MDRRKFLLGLGAAATISPIASLAQPAKVHRIGMLDAVPAELNAVNLEAFRKGLKELGYTEGRNFLIEYRSAAGFPDKFAQLAEEFVRLPVDVIVTRGTPAALAAKRATRTIPIVMASSGDPVGMGIVESLARPGGNITGLISFSTELAAKRVELLKEVLPSAVRIGLLANTSNPVVPPQWEETKRAAQTLGLQAELLNVRQTGDIVRAFGEAAARGIEAVLVAQDTVTQTNQQLIIDLAAQRKLPAFYSGREFVDAGGLISFRVSYQKLYWRAAAFVDMILKGAKPADMPVEQPSTLEIVINLRTAKSLGVRIPPSVLVRADEVIE